MKNAEEALEKFEGKMNVEVRRQERIDMAEKRNFQKERAPREIHSKNVV